VPLLTGGLLIDEHARLQGGSELFGPSGGFRSFDPAQVYSSSSLTAAAGA
jgi:hypothetical protein